MWKTLLYVALILPQLHVGTAQSESNATTDPFTPNREQQWWRQVQQELKKEFTRVQEELKEDINAAVIDNTSSMDCVDCEELQRLKYLGKLWKYPAWSCVEIAERKSDYRNGYYWVHGNQGGSPDLVYCDLKTKFSLGEKGWLRVANFNITDPNQQCPTGSRGTGFELITEPKPLCIRNTDQPGCSSVLFGTWGTTYRRVCGTVGAYRLRTTDGFFQHNCPSPCTIDEPYVDGVSITYKYAKQHVWTFHSQEQCNEVKGTPPPFVGNSYSCQSYTPVSFCRQLLHPSGYNLEVRVCRDQERRDEDIGLEIIELYVQ